MGVRDIASCALAAFLPAIYPTDSSVQVEISSMIPRPVRVRRGRRAARQAADCRARCPRCKERRVRHGRPQRLFRFHGESLAEFTALGRNHGQGPAEALWTRWFQAVARTISPSWSIPPAYDSRRRRMHSNRSVTIRCATQRSVSVQDHKERLVFLPLCHVASGRRLLHLAGAGIGDEFLPKARKPCRTICARVQPTAFLRCRGSGKSSIRGSRLR